jgi:menaquinone-dependent protoporphyrinogen oxidase
MKRLLILIIMSLTITVLIAERELKMGKVLIVYSSKTGSTGEIAGFMKQEFEKNGVSVDLRRVKEVKNLVHYDKIVIGSPIYMGKWNTEATDFLKSNKAVLDKKKCYFFLVAMSAGDPDPKKSEQTEKYLEKERTIVKPRLEGRFAGRIDFKKLNLFHRMISKMVGAKEEDRRNWKAIAEWVRLVASE